MGKVNFDRLFRKISKDATNTVTNEIIESKIAGVMHMNGAHMAKVNGMNIGTETGKQT